MSSDRACPRCGEPVVAIAGTKDSEVIEIEVAAHRRIIKRQRYRAGCQCGCLPAISAALPPPQLIPRGKLGISVWVDVLLSKYLYAQPTHRLCRDWRDRGLPIAQGTITDGLRTIQPLFVPLLDCLRDRLREADHWHADETDWHMFAAQPDKRGYRWHLWLFQSAEVAYFQLDPTRSAAVPMNVLGTAVEGVLSVDRYGAYQKYARLNDKVLRALCWAHQRRDFLALAIQHPDLWHWALAWLDRIGRLYHLHADRRVAKPDSAQFRHCDTRLRRHVERMRQRAEVERDDCSEHAAARRLLRLMLGYWDGLTVFLDFPEIDLDNNAAERTLRPGVVGRMNYYGSGSLWSGELAAGMLSMLATLEIWGINPRAWLTAYLQACANAGGHVPEEHERFLPWRLSESELAQMRQPLPMLRRTA